VARPPAHGRRAPTAPNASNRRQETTAVPNPYGPAAPSGGATAVLPPAPRRGSRIAIVSAGVGAGHDGAAAELQRRLTASGWLVDRHDFLDLLPARAGDLLRGTYRRMLTVAPAGYQRLYASTERGGHPGPLVSALLRGAEQGMLRALASGTRAVVSTYPGASQLLGRMRLNGRLDVPALTYLTDFSVHPLWIAPGIDRHLAAHPVPAAQARALGAAAVSVTGPVVDPRFVPAAACERLAARVRFGLPPDEPVALLVAGSWGVGAVEKAAAEIRASGVATPVVVCGRNDALAERLRRAGVGHVHGWVTDMPGLMQAADVLVQNAGGLTSLEAFAGGLPVATYRCIPGHGRTNAAALEQAGLAAWVRRPEELGPVLEDLVSGPRGAGQRDRGLSLFTTGGGPAEAIAAAAHRTTGRTARAAVDAGPAGTAGTAGRAGALTRRRLGAAAAALAVTATLAVGIPLADAYSDAPSHLGLGTGTAQGGRP
jgi:UDP-N-acetylglucosamine:LPS N-acetylglucosamine transferase